MGNLPEKPRYWCRACRQVGAIHCQYPDECGQMPEPSAEEADRD